MPAKKLKHAPACGFFDFGGIGIFEDGGCGIMDVGPAQAHRYGGRQGCARARGRRGARARVAPAGDAVQPACLHALRRCRGAAGRTARAGVSRTSVLAHFRELMHKLPTLPARGPVWEACSCRASYLIHRATLGAHRVLTISSRRGR